MGVSQVAWGIINGNSHRERTTTMRPRHLIHQDIFDALGGDQRIASLCCVEIGTVRKWRQDPSINGRDIPFVKFQNLLRETGRQINNVELQALVTEYLHDHVLGLCHRIAIPTDKAYEISRLLLGGSEKKGAANE